MIFTHEVSCILSVSPTTSLHKPRRSPAPCPGWPPVARAVNEPSAKFPKSQRRSLLRIFAITSHPVPYHPCAGDPISCLLLSWVNTSLTWCFNNVLNVKVLIGTFNQMMALVENLWKLRRRFVASSGGQSCKLGVKYDDCIKLPPASLQRSQARLVIITLVVILIKNLHALKNTKCVHSNPEGQDTSGCSMLKWPCPPS